MARERNLVIKKYTSRFGNIILDNPWAVLDDMKTEIYTRDGLNSDIKVWNDAMTRWKNRDILIGGRKLVAFMEIASILRQRKAQILGQGLGDVEKIMLYDS